MGPCGAKRQPGRDHPRAWGVGRTVSNQMLRPPPTLSTHNGADLRQDKYRLAYVDLSWTRQALRGRPFQEGKQEGRFAGNGQDIF